MIYPKVSIITPTYNVENTLQDTLNSVLNQSYNNIEHIIVDGCSIDNTKKILESYNNNNSKILIESDCGLYDAINKGIQLATGDIIGILNADDVFFDNDTISNITKHFINDNNLEACYGNIVFISNSNKIIRNYNVKNWTIHRFQWGFMPPHPSFFCKKNVYEKLGLYKIDYKIAADFELLIRYLYIHKIKIIYIPLNTTKMKTGGISTSGFKSIFVLNKEILRACKSNGLYTNYFMLYLKYFKKILEFI